MDSHTRRRAADGTQWTPQVADSGQQSIDPIGT